MGAKPSVSKMRTPAIQAEGVLGGGDALPFSLVMENFKGGPIHARNRRTKGTGYMFVTRRRVCFGINSRRFGHARLSQLFFDFDRPEGLKLVTFQPKGHNQIFVSLAINNFDKRYSQGQMQFVYTFRDQTDRDHVSSLLHTFEHTPQGGIKKPSPSPAIHPVPPPLYMTLTAMPADMEGDDGEA
ncbi:hypothetical protein KIPB_002695 [Kipferlia bialata]|uniref:Uncharacterized protein n=1 Tax=Kipferlia bialata TaxID=797122 RepID=A0A9K3CSU6_9EUKA|nr:hypothetical protein KIPB_002695 [Kipferlia bialata]|eukprot:g2695.t1